jgi:hypothetical protein
MEKNLLEWYHEYHIIQKNPVTSNMIKSKAIEFTNSTDFLASKGWLEKFKKKYKIDIIHPSKLKNGMY